MDKNRWQGGDNGLLLNRTDLGKVLKTSNTLTGPQLN